ncbi:hypothetical protein [Ferrovibrio sp.]|uniref:hypothetical protein n=1 Tax=Ferrovibrio sp. TaxID=1917215 RepID=UPI0035ADD994
MQTSEEATAQREADAAEAKRKAAIAAANATGRRAMLNPTTGALGVVAEARNEKLNSLY